MSLGPDQERAGPEFLSRRLGTLVLRRPGLALGLWGEAGIGKTYCALEALRGLPCRSLSLQAGASLQAVAQRLPRPHRLPLWAERGLDRLASGEVLDTPDTLNALAATLVGLAPFVLHLEDLHDAPPERTELLIALARMVTRARGVGLLVTSRSQPPEPFESLRLAALGLPGSVQVLEAETGAVLPAEAVDWIFERASGNPLFTLEYFRLLARQGYLWNDARRWRWREPETDLMPLTVEALIERILQDVTASEALGDLAGALALLPGESGQVVQTVTGLSAEQLREARVKLERQGVLAGGQFAHPLYRELLLRHLPPARRQGLARRVLAAFAHDPPRAAEVAASAGLPAAEALVLFEQAAAYSRDDPARAARFLARAVEYAVSDRRGRLALEAAQGLRHLDRAEALRLSGVALEAGADLQEAITLRTELLASQGQLPEALALLERLPLDVRQAPTWPLRLIALRAVAHDQAGVVELWRAHPELWAVAEPYVVAQVAFALVQRSDNQTAVGLVRSVLGWTQQQMADSPGALACPPGLEPLTACILLNVLGTVSFHLGDSDAALAWYTQELELARQAGQLHLTGVALSNRGMVLGGMGRNQERVADLEACLQLQLGFGNGLQATRTQVALADAYLDLAEYERAEELLLECRSTLSQLGPSDHLVECEYRLSVLYRDWAPPHGGVLAVRHAHAAIGYARQLGGVWKITWSLCYAAIAEARFGNAARAMALAVEAVQHAQQTGSPGLLGMAQLAEAHALEAAGERAEALQAYTRIEAILRAGDMTEPAQEVGLEADRLSGDRASAAARLAWFTAQGLHNLAHVARRYFPTLGVPEVSPGAPRVRLELLGELRLSDGRPLRGRKRQALLALLAQARLTGRAELPRLALLDALYPDAPELQASAALRDLVHQLRADLGPATLLTTEGGYALGELELDAAEFLAGGDTRLWRGPYLAGLETDFGEETVRDALYLTLSGRAQALVASDPVEAARLGRLLLEAEPYSQAHLRLTLQALRAGGNHRGLGRQYAQARARLMEVGESLPQQWSDFLASPMGAGT